MYRIEFVFKHWRVNKPLPEIIVQIFQFVPPFWHLFDEFMIDSTSYVFQALNANQEFRICLHLLQYRDFYIYDDSKIS